MEVTAIGSTSIVEITCANDGEAIAISNVDSIFDAWFTTKIGHAGLGLWIASDQLQRVGGRLTLVAVAPPTFLVVLPAPD